MSSTLAQLKARQQANTAAPANEIQTGMASSAAPTNAAATQPPAPPVEAAPEDALAELKKHYPDGGYLLHKVKRLILSNGTIMQPDEHGVIVTEDKDALSQLEHFVKQGPHMVQKF